MARYLPNNGQAREVETPLTLTALQNYVGGFIRFIELSSGDILVVNEVQTEHIPPNATATSLAGNKGPICGHAVVCHPSEIA